MRLKIAILIAVIGLLAAVIALATEVLKLYRELPTPTPVIGAVTTTDMIAGNWTGTFSSETDNLLTQIDLFIKPNCLVSNVCGTYSAPRLPCSGKLFLTAINGETFEFVEQFDKGTTSCGSGGHEYLRLLPSGVLSWSYRGASPSGTLYISNGVLKRP